MLIERDVKLKTYELMVALKPLLPDDLRKSIHKEFMELMSKDKGEVLDVDVWGKRYLSYKIKGHNEGYYIIYTFKVSPKEILELKRQMELKKSSAELTAMQMRLLRKRLRGISRRI